MRSCQQLVARSALHRQNHSELCLAAQHPLVRLGGLPWVLIHQGRISYSIYLFQNLILWLVPYTDIPALSIPVWFVCVTVLATVTYHTIERPMIVLGQRLSANGSLRLRSYISVSASDGAQEKTRI